ncbi:MAG: GYD domain-containing protein [Edaphobacter sp.]
MPTYISLCRWTQHGAQTIKDSPARLDAAKKALAADGVKILHFYMVTGSHDLVFITEAPNDEVMAKSMLRTLSQGGITTQTSRAFTEDEYRKIIKSV